MIRLSKLPIIYINLCLLTMISHAVLASDIKVHFINQSDAVVSLDYTDCEIDKEHSDKLDADGKFSYHSQAYFSCADYKTIKLTQYSGPYAKQAKCSLQRNGSELITEGSQYCNVTRQNDGAYKAVLQWPGENINYQDLIANTQYVITKFNINAKKTTQLIPNVISMSQEVLDKAEDWQLQFSYDASRYPLWLGAECLQHLDSKACINANPTLEGLLKNIKEVSQHGTLPSAGIWAKTYGNKGVEGQAVAKSVYPEVGSPALDGPTAVAEYAKNGNSKFYNELIATLSKYDLAKITPATAKNASPYTATSAPYFNGSINLLTQALLIGNGDLTKTHQQKYIKLADSNYLSKKQYLVNYNKWLTSGFIAPFTITDKAGNAGPAARVLFSAAKAPLNEKLDSWENAGESPTVSEGMAYGLLISYAADDQTMFDKFLRFILFTARSHGCAGVSADRTVCTIKTNYLMPWLVDQTGRPFHYTDGGGYWTNGSATDADLTTVWALTLAADAVKNGKWTNSQFDNMDYLSLAKQMTTELNRYDINKKVDFFGELISVLYAPGSQWHDAGRKVMYPGYYAPQAFEALDRLITPHYPE